MGNFSFTPRESTIKIYTDSFTELVLVRNFNSSVQKSAYNYTPLETGETEEIITSSKRQITFDYPLMDNAFVNLDNNETEFDIYEYLENEDETNNITYKYENCKITNIKNVSDTSGNPIIQKITCSCKKRTIVT